MIFVRGGTYDVSRKIETQDDSRGKVYSFKSSEGENTKIQGYKEVKGADNVSSEIKPLMKPGSKGKIGNNLRQKEEYRYIFRRSSEFSKRRRQKEGRLLLTKNQTINFLNRKLKATDKIFNNIIADNENINNSNLYLGNLSQSITEDMLFNIFRKYGEIENIKIIRNEDKNLKNIAFVCFQSSESAHKAKSELNEFDLCGFPIKIGYNFFN